MRDEKTSIFLNDSGKGFLRLVQSADLVFNVGGGNINSVFLLSGLYSRCFTYLVAKIFGSPVVISGQNIGPIHNWFDRGFAAHALNTVDTIALRDVTTSRTFLESLGVTKPLIEETTDDSFLLPAAPQPEIAALFAKEGIESHRPMVAISIQDWPLVERAYEWFAQIADHLVSERGAQVVFVPMQYLADLDDRRAARRVRDLMSNSHRVKILDGEYNEHILKGIISCMDLAIGTRYHFVVFAATSQVPCIAVALNGYYCIKHSGIMRRMRQDRYLCNVEEISVDEFISLVEDALENGQRIRDELRTQVTEHRELSLFSARRTAELLALNLNSTCDVSSTTDGEN